jgi:hypothetical protein
MGAAAWTIEAPGITIDMRKLNKDEQRKAIFEVVKFIRIRRDQILNDRG